MLTFKNHRGQFHKTNTALVGLTSLYVIGAAVALSAPYWVSSTCMLAPLATFAATPLGMGVLAVVAIALTSLAIYAISRNNKVSELEAWKIVTKNGKVMLQVTEKELEYIKANNQNKDKDGKVLEGEYHVDFNLEGKDYYITGKTGGDKLEFVGNTVFLEINSLTMKDGDKCTEIKDASKQLEGLGLNKKGAKEVNTYLGTLSSVEQAKPEEKKK